MARITYDAYDPFAEFSGSGGGSAPLGSLAGAVADDGYRYTCGCSFHSASFNKAFTGLWSWEDGVGDKLGVAGLDTVTNPLLLDDVGGDTPGTAQAITVGQKVFAVIEDLGDADYFTVTLEAGKTYAISQLLHVGGTATGDGTLLSGVPLQDAYVELYAADGVTKLAEADGGSTTTPSGLDAKLFFKAETTGTYIIKGRAFDQDATNGTGGDHVGDYTLQVREVAASNAPLPRFYTQAASQNDLLNSLDWGSQFARTSRNPDGDNGTRTDNGVPNGGTPQSESTYGITGKNVITFYFARQGDVFLSENPTNPGLETMVQAKDMLQWEKDAFYAAFREYEKVADVKYVEVDSREDAISGIRIVLYQGTPGVGASLLGRMSPPGEQNSGQMEINSGDFRWTEEGVRQGGFYFPTLLHELGHGHGMKHPHDGGGGGPEMTGAGGGTAGIGGAFGAFGLSQGIFTMMSYNDGWNETGGPGSRPVGQGGPRTGGITGTEVDGFGHIGTMAALDIAVIQDKYGVNEEWARGDDTYVIKDTNQIGNFYSTIWDGGGTDSITYSGARNANIDLRAATLKYEEGGAGFVSYALGAWTGFTIANGVTIENATSGSGNDILVGNAVANVLNGGAGADYMIGGLGGDTYIVDNSADQVVEFDVAGGGYDTIVTNLNYTLTSNVEQLVLTGASAVYGGGSNGDNYLRGNGLDNALYGYGGADTIEGGDGSDYIVGGAGNDQLRGGAGPDVFVYQGLGYGLDTIWDFVAGPANGGDAILFSRTVFNDYADVMDSAFQQGNDTVIVAPDGNWIALIGVQKANLTIDDFGFMA